MRDNVGESFPELLLGLEQLFEVVVVFSDSDVVIVVESSGRRRIHPQLNSVCYTSSVNDSLAAFN